jgi:hypothetical protein
MSLRPLLIAASSLVGLVGSALAGAPVISPFGIGVDLSFDTRLATGSTTPRTLAAQGADTFNVHDFGAVGNGTSQPIGATYGTTLAGLASYSTAMGTTPFAWVTNPAYGLTFSLTTSAAQGSAGTVLPFSVALSGINGWSQSAPQFNGFWPANQQYLVQPGMTVSGPCIAAGTTVASTAAANNAAKLTSAAQSAAGTTLTFLETVGLVAGQPVTGANIPANTTIVSVTATTVTLSAGTTAAVAAHAVIQFGEIANITLSAPTSAACGAGAAITFALSSAQVQALTIDYLGLQSAYAAASANGGGQVVAPAGNYLINRPVWNPGITNFNAMSPSIVFHGAGMYTTQITPTADFGAGACAIGESNRGPASAGYAEFSDFRIIGPGTSNTSGGAVAGMDGLCIGAKTRVYHVSAWSLSSGLNVLRDHQIIRDSDFGNNFYGIYFAPNSDTIGNQHIDKTPTVGNAKAGIATAWNNGIAAATLLDSDTGGNSPYSFYQEALPSGQTSLPISFLSYSVISNMLGEQVGNAYMYSESGGSVTNNTFVGGQPIVSMSSSSRLPGWTPRAVVYVGSFLYNTMENADFSNGGANFALVSNAIFEATVSSNIMGDQTPMMNNLSATIPVILTDNNGAGYSPFNRFTMGRSAGEFRAVEAAVTAGQVLTYGTIYAYHGARPMVPGAQPLGVAQGNAVAFSLVPVIEQGYVTVAKTAGTAIANGSPVCVSAATPTAVTACASAVGQPVMGSDVDGVSGAASAATTANIDVQMTMQPAIATTSAPGIVAPDGSTITVTAAGRISGAAVLGAVAYNPAADVGYACNGTNTTNTADVDATNLQVSFIAPPSGNVVVDLNAMVTSQTSGWQVYWSLGFATAAGGASSADIAGTLGMVTNSNADLRVTHAVRLTGLTAGTRYFLNWRQATNQSSAQPGPFILVGQGSTPYGAATMTVYSD